VTLDEHWASRLVHGSVGLAIAAILATAALGAEVISVAARQSYDPESSAQQRCADSGDEVARSACEEREMRTTPLAAAHTHLIASFVTLLVPAGAVATASWARRRKALEDVNSRAGSA